MLATVSGLAFGLPFSLFKTPLLRAVSNRIALVSSSLSSLLDALNRVLGKVWTRKTLAGKRCGEEEHARETPVKSNSG